MPNAQLCLGPSASSSLDLSASVHCPPAPGRPPGLHGAPGRSRLHSGRAGHHSHTVTKGSGCQPGPEVRPPRPPHKQGLTSLGFQPSWAGLYLGDVSIPFL